MAAKLELAAATMAAVSQSARAAQESEGGRVGRRVSARVARAFAFGGTGSRVARGAEVERTAGTGRALLHGCHGDNSTSTWRASLCPTWGPFFGIFRADSELGSSSKVALLRMVYKLG